MEKTAKKQENSIDNVDLHARIAELDKALNEKNKKIGELNKKIEELESQLGEKIEIVKEKSKKHIMLSNVMHNGQLFARGTEIKEPTLIALFLEQGNIS